MSELNYDPKQNGAKAYGIGYKIHYDPKQNGAKAFGLPIIENEKVRAA